LILGAVSALYAPQEISYEEKTLETWDSIASTSLSPPPGPHDSTFWGRGMNRGSWFELDLSFSDPLRVTVYKAEDATQTLIPIFEKSDVAITQEVDILEPSSYQIVIKNEGSTAVEILPGSAVAARQMEATKNASYLFQVLAILAISCGLIILLLGVFAKSKTRRLRGHSQKTRREMTKTRYF